jgi:hypothetical protein
MSTITDSNKAVASRLAQQVFSQGDMRAFDEIISENYVHHIMPTPSIPGTKAGFKKFGRGNAARIS